MEPSLSKEDSHESSVSKREIDLSNLFENRDVELPLSMMTKTVAQVLEFDISEGLKNYLRKHPTDWLVLLNEEGKVFVAPPHSQPLHWEQPASILSGLLPLSVLGSNEPPVPTETHGPGVCQYCGEHVPVLKTEPRSQKSYCRECAPWRETDADWPEII